MSEQAKTYDELVAAAVASQATAQAAHVAYVKAGEQDRADRTELGWQALRLLFGAYRGDLASVAQRKEAETGVLSDASLRTWPRYGVDGMVTLAARLDLTLRKLRKDGSVSERTANCCVALPADMDGVVVIEADYEQKRAALEQVEQ